MVDVARELQGLRGEVAELKTLILKLVSPATHISVAEKARLIVEAHASGDPSQIRKANKRINSVKP